MSIEIDVLNGASSWSLAEPLLKAVYPPHVVATLPWANITFAHPELRVLIQDDSGDVVSHVGPAASAGSRPATIRGAAAMPASRSTPPFGR